ncbi:WGR domain-containing protein [Myxococcota bacterium]
MAKVKAWKNGAVGEPPFPDDFEIVKKAVLQVTDIKTNRNKYYGLELHRGKLNGSEVFRVFSHYGRTDDLQTNPNAGQRECRYCSDLVHAQSVYDSLYNQKTSARKGYKELSLAASKIGSQKGIGTSSGQMDAKTIKKLEEQENGKGKEKAKEKAKPKVELPEVQVQDLVRYVYAEATNALTNTVNAKITAQGIETPLGILTIGQIEKGEGILEQLFRQFKQKKRDPDEMERLSGEFYTLVPHRIGRSRAAVHDAIIDTLVEFEQKQETLQLMKDMLQVNGEEGSVLFDEEIGAQYQALGCSIKYVPHDTGEYKELESYVIKSQVKTKSIRVKNIYSIKRESEQKGFAESIGNQRLLFHGSRIKNWVGLLSRGILLPKIVVSMGVNRTDAGWLGHGIYFGDAACTAAFYTTPGKKSTRLMSLVRVALGKMKDFKKITYGMSEPPPGYNSCHGVRRKALVSSQFDDDEYVIYDTKQQRMEYLVEFTA